MLAELHHPFVCHLYIYAVSLLVFNPFKLNKIPFSQSKWRTLLQKPLAIFVLIYPFHISIELNTEDTIIIIYRVINPGVLAGSIKSKNSCLLTQLTQIHASLLVLSSQYRDVISTIIFLVTLRGVEHIAYTNSFAPLHVNLIPSSTSSTRLL